MRRTHRLSLSALFVATIAGSASGQTARVQFTNASTYEAADTIDVYLNGRLMLDDLAYKTGTPFRDYPAGVPLRIEVKRGGVAHDAAVFYSEILTLSPGERYFAIGAGDPGNRTGQPSFKFFIRSGAPEGSDLPGYMTFVLFNNDPGGAVSYYARGVGEQSDIAEAYPYGTFSDILPGAKRAWDIDCFQAETGRVRQTVQNFARFGQRSILFVGFCSFGILSDGTTFDDTVANVAHLQLTHIASYPGAEAVDVSIDGRLLADDLPVGSSTAFVDVPSGLEEKTAPGIRIEVRASGVKDEKPLLTLEQKFFFGHRYVTVLAGKTGDAGTTPPVALYLTDLGADSTLQKGGRITTVFHGAAGTRSITLGAGKPAIVPFTQRIGFGSFETGVPLPRTDTTVVVMDGDDRSLLASFVMNLAETGLADSSLLLLTSNTLPTGPQRQSSTKDMALVAALPSGGELVSFEGTSPPPWWQKPWLLLLLFAGGVAVAFVGSQIRVRRLEARARELEKTVEERTQELRAEKEKTEEQARRLSELDEAKNRFFANISHEFRTPLTMVIGPLQDAIDGAFGAVEPRLDRQLLLMRRNSRRLLRLVNQLLDLSKLESGKMELNRQPGDLVSFLRELVSAFTPLAERRRVTLEMESDATSLPAHYDADALEKVFANLISNALKFTPEGGSVTVAVGVEENDFATTRTSERRLAEISLRDTGPGIPEEYLDRIFERFQQADTSIRRAHEGSGIGLTLARELAELHGGSLKAESIVGEGSTFTITLPVEVFDDPLEPDLRSVEAALLEEPLAAPDRDGLPGVGVEAGTDAPLIVIVEDNADVRSYLRSHLSSTYRLIEAADGEVGLRVAKDHNPDLIISDIMMPRMDGYEMCRLVREDEELKHTPVIMLTAKAGESDTVEGLQSGADDYLAKPFSVTELRARVANLIRSRRELEAAFSREVFVRPADIEITPEEEAFLDHLLDVVNAHLGDTRFNVDWLADEMGLSRRPLERRVETVTGLAPAALIRRLRLERASQLLRARAAAVSEIGYAVGFRSPAHFSKAFRQAFGESPSVHMKRSTATDEA